jgi:hypothetical protein
MPILVISLLTILAGTLLLAKFKKESAGKIFSYISWFFIIVGFLLFIGFIHGGIVRIIHHECPVGGNFHKEMMIKKCGPGMPGMKEECCPEGMGMRMHGGMCTGFRGCMKHDSLKVCCEKIIKGDSVTVIVKKE